MNLILLSGGSGKRLWPLSNDVRSKQFLKLLTDENGQKQSMVQRVYSQIKTAQPEADIVIATGISQIDAIRGQLGNNVDIVLEPERRDTFPAIVLASAYLALEKGMNEDEVVVVLPVDPYTELKYFQTLDKMEDAVKEGHGDIVLMGIKPTFPSPKYGYIVPNGMVSEGMHNVSHFTEKPSYEVAEQLIKQGAVWNGGVFAFKLGYLMNLTREFVEFDSYQELYSKYNLLEKISFDYEVVEKANSIAMVQYEGEWKDLGTWSTLTDEMSGRALGIVSMGECENTYVVNELSIPLLAMGTKNLVVAASPDGIIVSDINASARIKPFVDEFQTKGYSKRPMYEERRWGEYTVIDSRNYEDGTKSLTKYLTLNAGKSLSYQMHHHRDEIWTITNGSADFILDGEIQRITRGDVVYIKKKQKHAIKAIENLHFIEVQIGDILIEEDTEKISLEW